MQKPEKQQTAANAAVRFLLFPIPMRQRAHQTRRAADKDVRRFPPRQDGESENPDSSASWDCFVEKDAFFW